MLLCVYLIVYGQTEEGLKTLREAEAGNASAQNLLGCYYHHGWEGFPKNNDEAIKWYKRAIRGGNEWGMFYLGLAYKNIDEEEAIYWFKKYADFWYDEFEDVPETVINLLKELGVTYDPRTKSTTTSRTSKKSDTSTNDSSSDKLLYKGIFTISNQGYNAAMGGYTNAMGSDWTVMIEIYSDYISVNGIKCNYVSTSNGWRIYRGMEVGNMTEFYKVNPSNFEMSKYNTQFNPFTGGNEVWTYSMRKGETSFSIISNSNDQYNSSNDYQGTTTTDYQQRKKDNLNRTVGETCTHCKGSKKCPACNGTKVAQGLGNTYKCNVCNSNGDCPVCDGTGKTSWNR